MPRKNRSPKHIPYIRSVKTQAKRRFLTRMAAQKAADERMLLHPELELSCYQDIDGGWYLTSNKKGA